MKDNLVSAVFDSRPEAERALDELRAAGAGKDAISIIARQDDKGADGLDEMERDGEHTPGLAKGILGGAGLGTLLGVGALAIPGVGPLAAAGAIAATAIPGAAFTGALLGAAAGGLSKMLADHGVSEEDARYYEERLREGAVFVSVDSDRTDLSAREANDILYRNGGHSAGRAKAEAVRA